MKREQDKLQTVRVENMMMSKSDFPLGKARSDKVRCPDLTYIQLSLTSRTEV